MAANGDGSLRTRRSAAVRNYLQLDTLTGVNADSLLLRNALNSSYK